MTQATQAHPLRDLITRHRRGEAVGIASVCSAHPLVLEAAALQARDDGSLLLVEATSNQVDQYGGYTGLQPADFAALVHRIADGAGLPREQVVLGGEHLGPNRWRSAGALRPWTAPRCSSRPTWTPGSPRSTWTAAWPAQGPLSRFPGPLGRRARRPPCAGRGEGRRYSGAARRGRLRDRHRGASPRRSAGGVSTLLTPTSPLDTRTTLAEHRSAFIEAVVSDAWERAVALVVQPAVEFDHSPGVRLRPGRSPGT